MSLSLLELLQPLLHAAGSEPGSSTVFVFALHIAQVRAWLSLCPSRPLPDCMVGIVTRANQTSEQGIGAVQQAC